MILFGNCTVQLLMVFYLELVKCSDKKETEQTIHVWLDMLMCKMVPVAIKGKSATGSYNAYICTSCTHPPKDKLKN